MVGLGLTRVTRPKSKAPFYFLSLAALAAWILVLLFQFAWVISLTVGPLPTRVDPDATGLNKALD